MGCEPGRIFSGTVFPLDEILLLALMCASGDDPFNLESVVMVDVWGHLLAHWSLGRLWRSGMIELEKRRMEDGVDPALIRELEPVCGLVLLQDLEGTEPVGCEFWEASILERIRESGFVEEDLVTDFESLDAS